MTQLVVTQALQDAAAAGYVTSMKHARLGYNTLTRGAAITGSSESIGKPASNLSNWLTYERWGADTTPADAWVFNTDLTPVDYCGIAAHTLADINATVYVQRSDDGGTWSTVTTATPETNDPLLILFTQITAKFWRIKVVGDDAAFEIGIWYIGEVLAMQRGTYGGLTPLSLARKTKIKPTISESGQFIGRSVVRQSNASSIKWDNLTNAWYRQNFDPFVDAAVNYPFFFAWRPYIDSKEPSLSLDFIADEYFDGDGNAVSETPDGGFVWTSGDIKPTNSGGRDFVSVSFSMMGLANG